MTGTITYILARAGWRAMNGPLADERRRLAGAEPPAAYVSYDPRLLAGAGWYGYRIALKGGDRQMVERARYMLAERYIIRDGYEYYADGVYVFGVLLRERVPHYGIGGSAEPGPSPIDDWWGLKLTMPEGGTVTLRKNGSPNAVSLEVSTDAVNWTAWELVGTDYSYTLAAGETLCVRNTSETPVGFSIGNTNRWYFVGLAGAYVSGELTSLLCRENIQISIAAFPYCFYGLFMQTGIITMPSLSNISAMGVRCFQSAFGACNHLEETTPIPNAAQASDTFRNCFDSCNSLKKVTFEANVISAYNYIANWLGGVAATGDFYCPASLTIPTGASGIPSGWTRHDI